MRTTHLLTALPLALASILLSRAVLAEPPDQARPAEAEVDEAIRQQLQRWQKGNEELNALRQKEFEAWQKEQWAEFSKEDPVDRFKIAKIKREAIEDLIDAFFCLALAVFFGTYTVVKLRKGSERPVQEAQPPGTETVPLVEGAPAQRGVSDGE
jgi:hypothetical protein